MKKVTLIFSLYIFLFSCHSGKKLPPQNFENNKAIQIADEVMNAMGGIDNWNNTHFITWKFFGRRFIWDKFNNDVRIDELKSGITIFMNVKTVKGRVFKKEVEMTVQDSVSKYLAYGYKVWINDSYWIVMPFKLKDPGVNLKYIGERKTPEGIDSDVLQITFNNSGATPENKYEVFVDKKTHLVCRWNYFENTTDEKPIASNPWTDYKQYGKILLSSGRGENKIGDIGVFENLPRHVFENSEPVDASFLLNYK